MRWNFESTKFFVFLSTAIVANHAHSEADWVSVVWQNDVFLNVDGGGYTNGAFISLFDVSAEGSEVYTEPYLTRTLSWMLDEKDMAFSEQTLGQMMITPKDIKKSIPDAKDVPYAGLLFYRASHVVVDANRADMVTVIVGMVGPSSHAEDTQKFVHKVVDSPDPQGWDYQIKDQFVMALGRSALWRHELSDSTDLVILAAAQVGNLKSSVSGSAILRWGSGLSESFVTSTLSYGGTTTPMAVNGGWNVYAGIESGYVFNDIFVNGDTPYKRQFSELHHEQFAVVSGISYAWQDVSVTFAFQDIKPVDTVDQSRDRFGSISLAFRL